VAVWPEADWIKKALVFVDEDVSTHVPLTVMVLGPCGSRELSAAVMLGYVPPLPPGQPTVTFAACAAAGAGRSNQDREH